MSVVFFLAVGTGSEGHHTWKTCQTNWNSDAVFDFTGNFYCRVVSHHLAGSLHPTVAGYVASSGPPVVHSGHLSQGTGGKMSLSIHWNYYFTAYDKTIPKSRTSSLIQSKGVLHTGNIYRKLKLPGPYFLEYNCFKRDLMTGILLHRQLLNVGWHF